MTRQVSQSRVYPQKIYTIFSRFGGAAAPPAPLYLRHWTIPFKFDIMTTMNSTLNLNNHHNLHCSYLNVQMRTSFTSIRIFLKAANPKSVGAKIFPRKNPRSTQSSVHSPRHQSGVPLRSPLTPCPTIAPVSLPCCL